MSDDNRIVLTGMPVEIAGNGNDDTCKYATFLISVLNEYDRMGRMIPKESGEMYHETLRGFPVVAKLIKDRANRPVDFGAHEMRQYKKRNGEVETTFDTYPIGSVIDTWIEDREVAGYDGEKSCIMAKAKLWTCRSPEYFKVLDRLWDEHRVSSSWELITTQSEEASVGRKILRAFSFIGNALLGTTSIPAVKGAGMYEYAEAEEVQCETTEELSEALLKDLGQEENVLEENKNAQPSTIEDTDKTGAADTQKETERSESENTAVGAQAGAESNDTNDTAADTPENDTVGDVSAEAADISAPPVQTELPPVGLEAKIAELTNTVIDLKTENDRLSATVAELQSRCDSMEGMKAEYEVMKQEKAEAEKQSRMAALKALALSSGQITEAELSETGGDDTVKGFISSLDETGLKCLIADRIVNSRSSSKPFTREVNTASADTFSRVKTNLFDDCSQARKARAEKGHELLQGYINK